MTSWEQMSRRDQLAATHYDFYKDVHGIRPRWMNYDAMTEEQLEQELDQLSRESELQRIEEEKMQKVAIEKFELQVATLRASGAPDRETAIRWLHDAHNTNGDDDYLCYQLGLPYNYFRKVA